MRLNGTHSVYSFADVTLIINTGIAMDPQSYTITGEGVGSIGITRATDNSQHDVSADGSVMTSKIIAKNGAIAISVQQTSAANHWLTKWYNKLYQSKTSEWTNNNATLVMDEDGTQVNLIGLCPQKRPDLAMQASGQQITWNLLCNEIDE